MGQVERIARGDFSINPLINNSPWERFVFAGGVWKPSTPVQAPAYFEVKDATKNLGFGVLLCYSSDNSQRGAKLIQRNVDFTGVSEITFSWANAATMDKSEFKLHLGEIQVFTYTGYGPGGKGVLAKGLVTIPLAENLRVPADLIFTRPSSMNTGYDVVFDVSALATVASPIITGVTFSHRKNHGPAELSLSGSNFKAGMVVKLKREGTPDLICTVGQVSGTSASCVADIFALPPGQYKVVIVSDGQTVESGTDTEIEESVCYPAMALKRGKTGNTPMDMTYTIGGSVVKIRNLK